MKAFKPVVWTYPKDKKTGQYRVVSPGETKIAWFQNSMHLIVRMLLCMMKGLRTCWQIWVEDDFRHRTSG